MNDTIVALATPLGRSGIGVVRLSGPGSTTILSQLTQREGLEPRKAHLTKLIDPTSNDTIDEAIFIYFKAPHSFTGEDVVEISCHGSPVVLRRVIDNCLLEGARIAEAGEFSLRALANGRMDLTEAEAIRDLIDAQTVASAKQAVRQLNGEFSHELQPIKDKLLNVIVVLESALEFVEDDLPDVQTRSIREQLNSIHEQIETMASTYRAGHLLREGLKVAIVGRPNVGKSSLFNAFLGSERAIVTDIAGTTRDQIREKLTIGDIPISLIDTAGLRETTDKVEIIGVDRARRAMADADVVLVLIDSSEPITRDDTDVLRSVTDLAHIVVFNKIDKVERSVLDREVNAFLLRHVHKTVVPISAKTGSGLDVLKAAIITPFNGNDLSSSGFLVSDARHQDLLNRSAEELGHSIAALDANSSEEITLIGLHNALRYLGQITGETTTEDMLTRIFATFCIGK
jgi:tRNA modification GTPase